ncbi:UNVERIFIED_CONTAM: putative mitochondrial protein [Sesamum latifolium]|uniref:Mitochondrial protein n=1 Tax=Sesamum latifolium TaxID=2727402 RepID=A0AAW2XZ96_9LAMI
MRNADSEKEAESEAEILLGKNSNFSVILSPREKELSSIQISSSDGGEKSEQSLDGVMGRDLVAVPIIFIAGGKNARVHHIDVDILDGNSTANWRFTGFYGEPDASRRREVWEKLVCLSSQSDAPWLCAGDFNEVLMQQEKNWSIEGVRYTWCNRRQAPDMVWARLDRACGNSVWCERNPETVVMHIAVPYSDHVMLRVQWRGTNVTKEKRKCQFRFDARWLQSKDCQKSKSQRDLKELEETYRKLDASPINRSRHTQMEQVRREIEECHRRDMLKWKQHSKIHWLCDGYSNTRFFHSFAYTRYRQNMIRRLRDEERVWWEREEDIQGILLWYFREIFTSNGPSESVINEVLSLVQPRVTLEMEQVLATPFTAKEVKTAIFSMFPFKSPGPDGMLPVFFHKFWSIVDSDVTRAVLHILNDHVMLNKMNYTHIVLIPKCEAPKMVAQLRSINLCNVIVKMASKCVANRLKLMLDSILSQSKPGFIQGRLITDNVFLAFKLNHYLQSSRRSTRGCIALKFDMSKAYDRVEWAFLRGTLLRLGFNHRFVALVMLLVTTVSYSLTLNGKHFRYFHPKRGIRQGDALSPYLFIFCSEVFSYLIQDTERWGQLTGVAVARQAPRVSHLFFVNDTLVFCEATAEQIGEVRRILRVYARASRQEINLQKSTMVISGGVPIAVKHLLEVVLRVTVGPRHDKYLGLPAVGGRSREALFKSIRDRMWNRIGEWNTKMLSQAGKGVLVEAMLQSLPTYAMSSFQLPIGFLQSLESLMAYF